MTSEFAEANRWCGLRFQWGVADCILVLGPWIARHRGADPFDGDRLTYNDAGSCQRVTRFFSDPVAVLEDRFAKIGGLPRVAEPRAGDVGVVIADHGRRPSGALCLGGAWAMLSPQGPISARVGLVEALAVWRVKP